MEKNQRGNSGQTLVITALLVALLFISTIYYLWEVGEESNTARLNTVNEHISIVKLGSHHTVLCSLINITHGGETEVLSENLDRWFSIIEQTYLSRIYLLNTSLWNGPPYNDGVWIMWGSEGLGVSSNYVNLNLTILGMDAEIRSEFPVNITTSLNVEGFISGSLGLQKQIELTCRVLNEDDSALADSFTLRYYNLTTWNPISTYTQTDYGNGTYRFRFTAETTDPSVDVSVETIDWRGVFVQANTTCT